MPAVLLLFPFHPGRVSNAGEAFSVKGRQVFTLMTRAVSFIDGWHMPLLFVLAGASTYLALGRRTRREHESERVRRLLVPFLFGILVLIPPQTWYGARFDAGCHDSYLHYLAGDAFFKVSF